MASSTFGAISPAVVTGIVAGAGFGLINLLAGNWTTRKAIRLGERYAVKLMILGFLIRLVLLAAVILAVPRSWMSAEAFVVTFLVAFVLGVVIEAKNVMIPRSRKGGTSDVPRNNEANEIEVEAHR